MKFFLFLTLLFSHVVLAEKIKAPMQSSEVARFFYREFYPNTDDVLIIQSIKCDPKVNDLKVEKFDGEKTVVNGSVNVIHIYARSGNCKNSPLSSVWSETIKIPKNGKFTHVYITAMSDNILPP